MWTPTTRKQHSRPAARYQTDLTDAEWRLIEPRLPPARTTGRPRVWPNARDPQRHLLRTARRDRLAALTNGLSTLADGLSLVRAFREGSVFEKINHALVMADRQRIGREASPSAAIIDSQSVKTTESGGPRGYDAGKKINGRKRHALVDTDGRALLVEPHPANIQDRDGGGPLLEVSRPLFPFIEHVWADGGYNHERVTAATSIVVEIVSKLPGQVGFVVLPRRWVVERFFAWINRNRRLAKDFEATIKSAAAFLYAASVMLMVRRLARAS